MIKETVEELLAEMGDKMSSQTSKDLSEALDALAELDANTHEARLMIRFCVLLLERILQDRE